MENKNKIIVIFLSLISLLLIFNSFLQLRTLQVQDSILEKMPPTVGDLKNANQEERKKLLLKRPSISADIHAPVEVEITNTPIEVFIVE